jgi:hypothetical protein
MTEQGRTHQPTINGSSKGKQWMATARVSGQQLKMAAKGSSDRRRIAVTKEEQSWHRRWQMHLVSGQQRCMQLRVVEAGGWVHLLPVVATIAVTESSLEHGNINKDVK